MPTSSFIPHYVFVALATVLALLFWHQPAHASDRQVTLGEYLQHYSLPYASCDEGIADAAGYFQAANPHRYSNARLSAKFFIDDVLRDVSDYDPKQAIYRSTDRLKLYRRAYDAGQACGGRSADDILLFLFSFSS